MPPSADHPPPTPPPSPEPDTLARLLQATTQLLLVLTELVEAQGGKALEAPPRRKPPERPCPLRDVILGLLEATERPLKTEALARRAGRNTDPVSGAFRKWIGRLHRAGVIELKDGGWWLASRKPPR